jgi:cytochrome c oxidase cbb3-type subunit 3
MDLAAVAADKEAMEMGGRLFPDLLHPVPRRDGQGSRDKGFPNLTDKDWQWGGEPEQIVETITNGRIG